MTSREPEYEYKKVNTRDICVDPLYQRDLNKRRVAKIVKEFNPYLVNACKLSYRDGKLWVFDGQHTIHAMKAKHGNRDCMVDCKVFYGLTRLDEMELFIQQNGASAAVGTNDRYRAMYNNGDSDITGMVRCCEAIGIRVDFTKSQAQNKIIALSTLFRCYKTLDSQQFVDVLSIIKETWGGTPDSYSAEILTGMTAFYKTYYGEFTRRNLIKRLRNFPPVAIVRDGKAMQTGGNSRYGKIILGIYNLNTSAGRLEDKF